MLLTDFLISLTSSILKTLSDCLIKHTIWCEFMFLLIFSPPHQQISYVLDYWFVGSFWGEVFFFFNLFSVIIASLLLGLFIFQLFLPGPLSFESQIRSVLEQFKKSKVEKVFIVICNHVLRKREMKMYIYILLIFKVEEYWCNLKNDGNLWRREA